MVSVVLVVQLAGFLASVGVSCTEADECGSLSFVQMRKAISRVAGVKRDRLGVSEERAQNLTSIRPARSGFTVGSEVNKSMNALGLPSAHELQVLLQRVRSGSLFEMRLQGDGGDSGPSREASILKWPAVLALLLSLGAFATMLLTKKTAREPEASDAPGGLGRGTLRRCGTFMAPPVPRMVYVFAACAALNSCNLGFDFGVNTGVGPLLQRYMNLSDSQIEWFNGSMVLFEILGAMMSSSVANRFGRRMSFVGAAVGFEIGILTTALADSYFWLIAGRTLVGLGCGLGLAIDPMYIAEISPPEHRGGLVTWSETGINVGIILGFASYALAPLPANIGWRLMIACGGIIPIVVFILALFVMPESPRWLVLKGRDDEAENVFRQLYPDAPGVDQMVQEVRRALKEEEEETESMGWKALLWPRPALKRMLKVGLGIAFFQQASGISALQYFMLYILEDMGVTSQWMQLVCLITNGVVKLLYISVAGLIFDRLGRRPCILTSFLGMSVLLAVTAFVVYDVDGPQHTQFMLLSLLLYYSLFSLGAGPGCWLLTSEVFSNQVRANAMSVATSVNTSVAFATTTSCLTIRNSVGWSGFFALYAFLNLVAFLYLYIYMPETKGKTLEDMLQYFQKIASDGDADGSRQH